MSDGDRWGPPLACAGAWAALDAFYGLVPTDPDTPWHIAQADLVAGQWAHGNFAVNAKDAFSWTAPGLPWHPNGWGFQVLLGAVWKAAGWAGVAVLRVALLGALVAACWHVSARLSAGRWARAGAVWVTAAYVIPWAALRPQLVSYVLLLVAFELTYRALDAGGAAGPGRGRLGQPWSPPVAHAVLAATISVWACLHGAVAAGVVALVVACAGDALDRRSLRRPLATAAVCVLASLASPYGVSLWTYAVSNTRESVDIVIEEWQPPSLSKASDVAATAVIVAVAVAAVMLACRRPSPTRWRMLLPALLLAALAFQAVRNQPFALLALVPFTAQALTELGGALGRRGWAVPVHPGRALAAVSFAAVLTGATQLGSSPLDPDPMQSSDFPQATRALPAGCRLLNEYAFGGFVILARPDVPVSQDGRNNLYGIPELRRQQQLLATGGAAPAGEELDRRGITCVLAEPDRPLLGALAQLPGWRRLATDDVSEAWATDRS